MTKSRVAVVIWLLGLLVAAAVISRTRFSPDMTAFLPRSPLPAQRVLVDQLREGVVSRLVLLAIEGAPPDTLTALSKALAGELRHDAAFGLVSNGDAADYVKDRDLLWNHRYLLSPRVSRDHFTPEALRAALDADIQMLGSDMGMIVKQTIPADPTGEMRFLIGSLDTQAHPAMHDGVWVSRDGSRALLMVRTVAAGFDIDGQERALARIEAAFAHARQTLSGPGSDHAAGGGNASPDIGVAAARLVETGPPVFAVQTRARMIRDVSRLSLIASLLVAAILLYAYRSPRVLVLALLPVLSGVAAGIASVSLAFGFVHGITLGFGVTLIGEAVDYAIYLFTQTAPGTAPSATLTRIWPILRLGMLTSVCGFSAMLLSSFTGFAQLGAFTVVGLVVALGVTRFVLPALLPAGFATTHSTVFAAPLLALFSAGGRQRWIVAGLSVAAVLSLAVHRGPYWDDELSSMSPLPAVQKSLDDALRREIGAPDVRYLLVVRAADRDAALAASERVAAGLEPLVASGAIGGFEVPSTWLPARATQQARRDALPDAPTLSANLARSVEGTGFRVDVFAPFLADVEAARHRPLLRHADLDGTGIASQVNSLLVRDGGEWLAIAQVQGVTDIRAVQQAVAAMAGDNAIWLDLKAESDRLLDTYLREALTLSVAGSLVVVLLLSVSLRSARRTATVLLPLAAAVVCTAAILLVADGRLSIFNLFGLLLVVAVGSNYCLFFERHCADMGEVAPEGVPNGLSAVAFHGTSHRASQSEAASPLGAIPTATCPTGASPTGVSPTGASRMIASLVLADLWTVIGFGILSFSGFPVLNGIGLTVAIGACLSLIFGAMLSGRGQEA